MTLQVGPANSWLQRTGLPSRLFETGRSDYELYEEDDEIEPSGDGEIETDVPSVG